MWAAAVTGSTTSATLRPTIRVSQSALVSCVWFATVNPPRRTRRRATCGLPRTPPLAAVCEELPETGLVRETVVEPPVPAGSVTDPPPASGQVGGRARSCSRSSLACGCSASTSSWWAVCRRRRLVDRSWAGLIWLSTSRLIVAASSGSVAARVRRAATQPGPYGVFLGGGELGVFAGACGVAERSSGSCHVQVEFGIVEAEPAVPQFRRVEVGFGSVQGAFGFAVLAEVGLGRELGPG